MEEDDTARAQPPLRRALASIRKLPRVSKIYLAVISSIALFMFIAEIVRLAGKAASGTDQSKELYGALLLSSIVFFVYFAFDAILYENMLQVIAFIFVALLYTSYIAVQYSSSNASSAYKTLSVVQLILIICGNIFVIVASWSLYKEFGWRVYTKIGSNPDTQKMYRTYQVFLMLDKLDVQLQIVLIAENLAFLQNPDNYEFYLNILAIPFVIALAYGGYWVFLREKKTLAICFVIVMNLEPIYIGFRLAKVFSNRDAATGELDYQVKNLPIVTITTSAVVGLLMRVALIVVSIFTIRNFNKGLQEASARRDTSKSDPSADLTSFRSVKLEIVDTM